VRLGYLGLQKKDRPRGPEREKRKVVVAAKSVISVVDDDQSVRESLASLLRSMGFEVRTFASAQDFLASDEARATGCLLLDLRMPGMGGLELQQHLAAADVRVPIVFLTAHGDEEARARALRAGAVDFLTKPFSEKALLDSVHAALRH
jgi:two-component system response regulator FixJ